MNIQKLIAIVAAILINCAVLAWFHAWTSSVVASAMPAAPMQKVVKLPAINVHPSAEQLRALRRGPTAALQSEANAGAAMACLVMPYYSFADPCDGTVSG